MRLTGLLVAGLAAGVVYFQLLRLSIFLALFKKLPLGFLPLLRSIRLAGFGGLAYLAYTLEPSGIVAFVTGFVGGRNILLSDVYAQISLEKEWKKRT
jgi:hypothetical protein